MGPIRDVSRDDVKAGLADGSITVVDVREAYEFDSGHIPGSVSMPLSGFDPGSLPAGVRVVFSCAAGVRSQRAVDLARAAGLPHDEHYAGGFKGWAAAGETVAFGSDG